MSSTNVHENCVYRCIWAGCPCPPAWAVYDGPLYQGASVAAQVVPNRPHAPTGCSKARDPHADCVSRCDLQGCDKPPAWFLP